MTAKEIASIFKVFFMNAGDKDGFRMCCPACSVANSFSNFYVALLDENNSQSFYPQITQITQKLRFSTKILKR